MNYLPAFFVVLAVVGCGNTADPDKAPSPAQDGPQPAVTVPQNIRVATYNINYFAGRHREEAAARYSAIVRAIEQAGADLVLLQEVTAPAIEFIRDKLKDEYSFHFRPTPNHYLAGGFAVLSKLPIVGDVIFSPPKHGLFGLLHFRIGLGDTTVHVLNVHLEPARLGRTANVLKLAKAMSAAEKVRQQETQWLLGKVDLTKPTIIAGDFNSFAKQFAPTEFRKNDLVDSHSSVNPDVDLEITWKWGVLAYRLDYIFHTPHFSSLSCDVHDSEYTYPRNGRSRSVSDHRLVVSSLRLEP